MRYFARLAVRGRGRHRRRRATLMPVVARGVQAPPAAGALRLLLLGLLLGVFMRARVFRSTRLQHASAGRARAPARPGGVAPRPQARATCSAPTRSPTPLDFCAREYVYAQKSEHRSGAGSRGARRRAPKRSPRRARVSTLHSKSAVKPRPVARLFAHATTHENAMLRDASREPTRKASIDCSTSTTPPSDSKKPELRVRPSPRKTTAKTPLDAAPRGGRPRRRVARFARPCARNTASCF